MGRSSKLLGGGWFTIYNYYHLSFCICTDINNYKSYCGFRLVLYGD
jgi:hypothetical protein